jgi:hypothetical protein
MGNAEENLQMDAKLLYLQEDNLKIMYNRTSFSGLTELQIAL